MHIRDDSVDILGQQPFLKIYTQICFCFQLPDSSSRPEIFATLKNGLERLTADFPWVAGQVANEGASERSTGVFKIKPLNKIPPLVVKNLTADPDAATMETLRHANFPFSMLDESIVAPCRTIPRPDFSPFPVFLIQATLVTGGLLLTFAGEHQTMDMTGQGHLIRHLCKACRGERFTDEEVRSGNLARGNIIPLLDDSYDPSLEVAHQIMKPIVPASTGGDCSLPAPPPVPRKCTWGYFLFSAAALAALKKTAMEGIDGKPGYVSSDDAVTAFAWKCVTRARLPRLEVKSKTSFARAVNVRSHLGVPETYLGLVQNMTYHSFNARDMVDEPLGTIASDLRSPLQPESCKLGHLTRVLATSFDRTPDRSVFSFVGQFDASTDIMLSSWAKVDCYEQDFNLGLGKPEAVRRPRFDAFESLAYLMPKSPGGEIALAICLRDEDMERLKADDEMAKYATYVG